MKVSCSLRFILVFVTAAMIISLPAADVEAAAKMPAKVKGLKVAKAADTYIELSWSKAKNAKKYQVSYKASTEKKWSQLKTKNKRIKLAKLKADNKYSIKVCGINGSNKGQFSKTIKQKTYATPERVEITSIYAKMRSRRDMVLAWAETDNTSFYEISTFLPNGSDFGSQTTGTAEYDNVYHVYPGTLYGFKVRSVNAKTGRFPAVKSDWTPVFYTCTTTGDRVITGTMNNDGVAEYTMTGTVPFRIGEDDSLLPTRYVDKSDEYGPVLISEKLICDAASFPSDFESDEVAGKTVKVGDTIEGEEIRKIVFELSFGNYEEAPDGYHTVTLDCGNYNSIRYTFEERQRAENDYLQRNERR